MSAFGEAFKKARAAGKKVFTYNGKKYNTKTKDDVAKAKAKPKSSDLKPVKVTAKRKTAPAPKAKATAGGRASRKLREGTLPGREPKPKTVPNTRTERTSSTVLNTPKATASTRVKRKTPAPKPKPKRKTKPKSKSKKYGRQKDTVILNSSRSRK